MKHYHKNPRQITEKQFSQLKEWLEEYGDLSGIVHNVKTDELIGGNQRAEAMYFIGNGAKPVITQRYKKPTKQGTIAQGYFEYKGERFNYRQVQWSAKKAEAANIIANKAGGSFDFDILANEFEVGDLLNWGFSEKELQIGGMVVPDFQPVGIDEQGRLDQKSPVVCPNCKHEFVPK